jgi:transglutaminase-like putative cysteine protease
MKIKRKFAIIAAVFALILMPAIGFGNASAATETSWYLVRMGGQDIGFSVIKQTALPSGMLETETDTRYVINRKSSIIRMRIQGVMLESPDGKFVSASQISEMSDQETRLEAVLKEKELIITQQAGDRKFSRTQPVEHVLLGSRGIELLSRRDLQNPGDTVTFHSFMAELGMVVETIRIFEGEETMQFQGEEVGVRRITEELPALGIRSLLYVDGEGRSLRQVMPGPFGEIEILLSTEEEARASVDSGQLPEEMYTSSQALTQIRLPQPRKVEWLSLRLRHRNPDLGWPDLTDPLQKVVKMNREELRIEVTVPGRVPAAGFPAAPTNETRAYLEPNAYIQSDDPELSALAQQLVEGEKDAFSAAMKLEAWTARNMSFDLGITLAPSTEVFQNRRGTCTEYAVLLTTLARSVGIPSRFAMGYVYAQRMFGGHAWVEVLIGDVWIPIDAALYTPGPADAARLKVVHTSFEEGPGILSASGVNRLFGQCDIDITGYRLRDETKMPVPVDAQAYTIKDNRYINPWLGLEVEKPSRFVFENLDQFWPDDTIVGLRAENGDTAALQVRPILPWIGLEETIADILADAGLADAPLRSLNSGRLFEAVGSGRKAFRFIAAEDQLWVLDVTAGSPSAVLAAISIFLDR